MVVLNIRYGPQGGVIIMRPSVYGNPYKIGVDGDRATVIAKYKRYFWDRLHTDEAFLQAVLELEHRDLVCCCAPLPCHGDVIKAWFEAGCPL